MPNLSRRSTTGTTLPRRLMTPRMNSGVRGTFVIDVKSSTSRTLRDVERKDLVVELEGQILCCFHDFRCGS